MNWNVKVYTTSNKCPFLEYNGNTYCKRTHDECSIKKCPCKVEFKINKEVL